MVGDLNGFPLPSQTIQQTSFTLSNMCKMYTTTETITAGADLTINFPIDWTNGFLEVVVTKSATTDYYESASGANSPAIFYASYDSLTNTSYTNAQVFQVNNFATIPYSVLKTQNKAGNPKSATATSVTLDSDGTAAYVKIFVYAPYNATITGVPVNYNLSGSGAPTMTPTFAGQEYYDNANKIFYKAGGVTSSADWVMPLFKPSFIHRIAGTTRGSTNTGVVIYSGAAESVGTDITYVNSATLGGSFTINTSGIYSISATKFSSSGAQSGIEIRSNTTVTNGNSDGYTKSGNTAIYNLSTAWTGYITAGYKVWIYSSEAPTVGNDWNNTVSIARVA